MSAAQAQADTTHAVITFAGRSRPAVIAPHAPGIVATDASRPPHRPETRTAHRNHDHGLSQLTAIAATGC